MVISTEQGSIMTPATVFAHTPYKLFRLFAVKPFCFDVFDIFFRLLHDHLLKDVEAVHVNSRPWSVKDNKQLLKPREIYVGKYNTSSQSKQPYLSLGL